MPYDCGTMQMQAGLRLGPYEVIELLGAGGMGEVWKAMDTRLDRLVAVKVLQAEWAAQPEWLDRFRQEAKAVAALNHPSVLGIFDVGSEGDTPFAVMELLLGETLRSRLRRGPLAPKEAVELGLQIARGLSAAHAKGIVHRDLKPENLWINEDGKAKILDFGLAKRTSESDPDAPTQSLTAATERGVLVGTVCYMSPEQIRGEEVGARSDLFSLGAVLWETLTGHKAFARPTASAILAAIMLDDPGDLSQPPYSAPPGLAEAIRRCLLKEPSSRFDSAADLAEALAATAQEPPRASARSGPSIAVLPFANLSGSSDQDHFSDGISEEIIGALMSLNGLRVAARTSSFAFRNTQTDVRRIGEELGVRHLLEGSVRVAGGKLRVSAQLISVEDGCQAWSGRYDRALEDVFEVQDEIARAIAQALEVRLLGSQQGRLVHPATQDAEAYDLFLRGRAHYNKRAAAPAIACFEAALARDPSFAEAYCGLANAICIQGFYGGISSAEALARSRAAVEKARALAPGLAAPRLSRAIVEHYYGWDFAREEQELKEAIHIQPGAPEPYYWMGALHYLRGMPERAEPYAEHLAELDPLSPTPLCARGEILRHRGRPAVALPFFERAYRMAPESLYTVMCLDQCLQELGRDEEAAILLERAVNGSGRESTFILGQLGSALARAGRHAEARAILHELKARAAHAHVAPLHLAFVETSLGDMDAALASMTRAVDERNGVAWHYALHEPTFAALRKLDGFEALRAKIPGA